MTGASIQNRWFVLAAVIAAFMPIVIDLTILHIAVPSLTLALSATGTQILWIIDIYPLVMASLLIPMGTLADRIGHRTLLFYGLLIFLIASVAAAFSPNAEMLIGARGLMAVGSAMVLPCILAIIRQTFTDDKERAFALGIWAAVGSAGAAVGPLIGGLLLERFWWGSVFLVNVPILLVVGPLALLGAPRGRGTREKGWTIGQALMLMSGLMALVYGVKTLAKPDASVVLSAVSIAFGVAMLFAYVRRQLRASNPMLDLGLFQVPAIRAGVLMGLVVMGSLAGVELTLAQELQFSIGKTPLEAGIFMLPLMIAAAVGGPLGGWITGHVGLRNVAVGSIALAAVAMAGLGVIELDDGGPLVIALLATLGLSLSIGLTASSVAIMSSASAEKGGSAGALEATSYDLGTGLGITGFGLLMANMYTRALQVPEDIASRLPDAATHSIGETMLAAKALAPPDAEALSNAGRVAFSQAHGSMLLFAAVFVGVLAIAVFFILRKQTGSGGAHA